METSLCQAVPGSGATASPGEGAFFVLTRILVYSYNNLPRTRITRSSLVSLTYDSNDRLVVSHTRTLHSWTWAPDGVGRSGLRAASLCGIWALALGLASHARLGTHTTLSVGLTAQLRGAPAAYGTRAHTD